MSSRHAFLLAGTLTIGFFLGACFVNRGPAPPPQRVARAELHLSPREEERVKVFREASRAIVHISNNALVRRGFGWLRQNVEEVPQGTGSGIVWDKKGHVLTNFHVVATARTVTVTLSDQSVHRVEEVVGFYPDKDLALLRIDAPAEKLHPIKIGRSSALLEGMDALVIGNPFGLNQTLSAGVISALGWYLLAPNGRRITDVIQTDAAVNRGNSGGALLNSHGELVGITTAILSPSGTSAGIAFAVPIDAIRPIVEDLIEHGKIRRPGLGVELYPDRTTRNLGIEGVLIHSVAPGSSAEKGGLRGTRIFGNSVAPGDVITSIDGQPVRSLNDLLDILEDHEIGDEVEVGYLRDDKKETTRIELQSIEPE